MQLSAILYPEKHEVLPLVKLISDDNNLSYSLRTRAIKTLRELRDCYKSNIEIPEELKKYVSKYFLHSIEFMTIKGGNCKKKLDEIWGPLKAQLNYDLENSKFVAFIKATGVLYHKSDDTKWNWYYLLEVFENFLHDPSQMKVALELN